MNETERLRLARRIQRSVHQPRLRWFRLKTGRCEWSGKWNCPWHPRDCNHPGAD